MSLDAAQKLRQARRVRLLACTSFNRSATLWLKQKDWSRNQGILASHTAFAMNSRLMLGLRGLLTNCILKCDASTGWVGSKLWVIGGEKPWVKGKSSHWYNLSPNLWMYTTTQVSSLISTKIFFKINQAYKIICFIPVFYLVWYCFPAKCAIMLF